MNSGIVQMIVTLLGGLVIFIYGMNLMSDGLQKAAGEKMKNIYTHNKHLFCCRSLNFYSAVKFILIGKTGNGKEFKVCGLRNYFFHFVKVGNDFYVDISEIRNRKTDRKIIGVFPAQKNPFNI